VATNRAWTAAVTGSYDLAMPVCQRCGEDNPERARFCLACAAPLAAPAASRREERKRVSVLFCDLVGFTSRSERLDVEDVRGLLTPYYQRLRADLERFGGTVEKFIGDAVMALFGAPVAHEDDPERAVRAALAICETIAELNEATPEMDLHVRIGVTTGEALVTLDARPVEGEGMASGDVVNTAARLQAAAPVDGVLVDATTRRAADRAIRFEAAEPVAAKGKAEPVAVWLALGPRSSLGVDVAPAPATPLVGRDHELGLLRDALARIRRGQSQLLTLVGVPGIGKSRLVAELLGLVEAEPELTTWRQGRSLPYGEGVAFWALGETVKAEAGILETDPAEVAAAKLDRAATSLVEGAEAAWVAAHLRPLVGLTADIGSGGDRQAEAFAAWRRFLEALAERGPTVLVFEDLHWADDALLDFLDHLMDWVTDVPLLVVGTARPELLARRPGWGGGKANSATLSLAPLAADDTARLIAGLLDQVLLPADIQVALLARAGGNPLFAEEYVRMLADQGFLRRTGSRWRLEDARELPLPESVQGIIAARLDALGPEEKALLQDAAVIGKVVWVGALAALGEAEPSALEPRLHALERRELLRRERRSAVAGERQYAFRHVLVRDVAYAQLPRAARAERHRRAAEWLQTLAPDRAEDRAELLAHHYASALQLSRATGQDTAALAERARLALREAGDRALELNAFAAAARWYTAALEQWPAGDQERPRLLLRLGQARVYGEQRGEDVLEQALDGLVATDQEAAADAASTLSQLAWWQGQGERAFGYVQQAAELLGDAPPSRTRARVLNNLSILVFLAGRVDEAIAFAQEALAIAERLGVDDMRVRALGYLGTARVFKGDTGGIADLEQAIALAVERNLPESAEAYVNLGASLIELGDLPAGLARQAEGRQAAERFGIAGWARHLRAELVVEHYLLGRWDQAVRLADEFIAESEAGARHYMEPACRLVRGRIRLARGELAAAREDADKQLALAREAGDPQVVQPAIAFAARAALEAGDRGRAEADAGELLALVKAQGGRTSTEWAPDLATVLVALDRGGELAEVVAAQTSPFPWLEAAAALATGDFARAAELYAAIGSLADAAFASLRAAEQLQAGGGRAEGGAHLQRALAFYRQARANAYLRRAEALLAASA
jgi:class 3 adenylate cyclase/tetratricopeptide (TPR) repeat protein